MDFSDERVEYHHLDNGNIEEFLQQNKEDWVACRWINVNGLSWDVIRTLGNHKNLHRLAIEDLMNTKGRTKADWYSDQAFCKCYDLLRPSEDHQFNLREELSFQKYFHKILLRGV